MFRFLLRNEHPIDRAIRVGVGLGFLSLLFVLPHSYLWVIGVIPLATGVLGSCPLYRIFGISTCSIATSRTKS
jgi:hypothetical protein